MTPLFVSPSLSTARLFKSSRCIFSAPGLWFEAGIGSRTVDLPPVPYQQPERSSPKHRVEPMAALRTRQLHLNASAQRSTERKG